MCVVPQIDLGIGDFIDWIDFRLNWHASFEIVFAGVQDKLAIKCLVDMIVQLRFDKEIFKVLIVRAVFYFVTVKQGEEDKADYLN